MRVGLLSKGLLLHEHLDLHLVVLCTNKPTHSIVRDIVDQLPNHLEVSFCYVLELVCTQFSMLMTSI
jgi:hypothetical protein